MFSCIVSQLPRERHFIQLLSGRASTAMAQYQKSRSLITLTPETTFVDEKVAIRVRDLPPNSKVTVVLETSRNKVTFQSAAHFTSTEDGQLDLATAASSGGSYTGVHQMGLFATLISKKPVSFAGDMRLLPYTVHIHEGHLIHNEIGNQPIESWSFDRKFYGDSIKRIPVYYKGVHGTLFLPPGNGPFPGLIDIYGGNGGLVDFRAGMLARQGFAAFAVAYVGYADLPRLSYTIDVDYFAKAVQFLQNHPQVQQQNIGAYGQCLGGLIAQVISRYIPEIKCCVAISAPVSRTIWDIKYEGEIKDVFTFGIGIAEAMDKCTYEEGSLVLEEMFAEDKLEKYIPLGLAHSGAKYFLSYGGDDRFFGTKTVLQTVEKEFEGANNGCYEVMISPGAGHIIHPPYLPLFRKFVTAIYGQTVLYGGQPLPHSHAQEEIWTKSLNFLRRNLIFPNKL